MANAAEIALDINLMRDDCGRAARAIVGMAPLDEAGLEEIACLDDALAVAHRTLHAALRHIQALRARRSREGTKQ
jgi:hypothetical protein